MTVAGIKQDERIREVLPKLSRRMRTAFAAAAAERVLPIVEYYFGSDRNCRAALELAWRFATGEDVEAEARTAADACERLLDELYDDEETGYTLYATGAIFRAVSSILSVESKTAEDAASEATDAARIDDDEEGDAHVEEEANWQMRALDVALAAREPARDMFKHLPFPPRWLRKFQNTH